MGALFIESLNPHLLHRLLVHTFGFCEPVLRLLPCEVARRAVAHGFFPTGRQGSVGDVRQQIGDVTRRVRTVAGCQRRNPGIERAQVLPLQ